MSVDHCEPTKKARALSIATQIVQGRLEGTHDCTSLTSEFFASFSVRGVNADRSRPG